MNIQKENSLRNTWGKYTNSWSETEVTKRLAIFKECLATDCLYTDPLIQTIGHEALSNYVTQFQSTVKGGRFVITEFMEHHDQSLAHWNMVGAGGAVLGTGASFGVYSPDGRLQKITGFFKVPSGN